jgi:UDP-glucose 4-epimerase
MNYQFELAQWRVEPIKVNIAGREAMDRLFAEHKFSRVIHLAARAGVRNLLKNPRVRSKQCGWIYEYSGRMPA